VGDRGGRCDVRGTAAKGLTGKGCTLSGEDIGNDNQLERTKFRKSVKIYTEYEHSRRSVGIKFVDDRPVTKNRYIKFQCDYIWSICFKVIYARLSGFSGE
jgi:hypothetical protein